MQLHLFPLQNYLKFYIKVKQRRRNIAIFAENDIIIMSKAKIGSILQTEKVGLFSIIFEGNDLNEFERFKEKFKDDAKYQANLNQILTIIGRILQTGALERYFRYEGKPSDHVVALPTFGNRLRLYCLRMTDSILIVGNGSVKDTRTYQESSELNGYVISLQKLNSLIMQGLKDGSITIEQTDMIINEDKTFDI